jgi:hypothetical protein
MTDRNNITLKNPLNVILNKTTLSDLEIDLELHSSFSNFHLKNYQDYSVNTNLLNDPDLLFAIITMNSLNIIESVIYRYKSVKFDELFNIVKENPDTLSNVQNNTENYRHVTFDQGDSYAFLWLQLDASQLDLQYASKEFISRIKSNI